MTALDRFEDFISTFMSESQMEEEDYGLLEEERKALEEIEEGSEIAAIFYEHYLEVWLGIFFGGYGDFERGDAIAHAVTRWDEGHWAAPGDWVQVPSLLKLAHEGCRQAWAEPWKGAVRPLMPFGSLLSDPPYGDTDAYAPGDPEEWF